MNKRVSIVVPVYNSEKHLKKCINSILNQKYKNWELILVDDCSKDNSLDICYEFEKKDKRIKTIAKDSNTKVSDTRNVGIENATGDYIMFVDADDYVSDDFVEAMVKAIEEKNVDVVRCKAFVYKKDGSYKIEDIHGYENKILKGEEIKTLVKSLVAYCDTNIASYACVLILKRKLLQIRFNPSVIVKEDMLFSIETFLTSTNSIYFLNKPLYHYCYNENSATKSIDGTNRYIDGLVKSNKEVKKVLKRNHLLDKNLEININYTDINMIVHSIYAFSSFSVFKVRDIVKTVLKKEEVRDILENINIKYVNFKGKVLCTLLKLHLYLIVSMYIKIFKTKGLS